LMQSFVAAAALSASAFSSPAPAGARAGVIGKLFPTLAPIAQQIGNGGVPLSFTQKKQATLRWRVAQARAAVDRARREIEALEARSAMRSSSELQRQARLTRIAEVRRDAGLAESRIILLKEQQRRLGLPSRRGWVGDAQRVAETFLASEERSARVLFSTLSKQRDPWDLIRQDTVSLLRLGSNASLIAGYAQLRDAPRLVPHAAAIAARMRSRCISPRVTMVLKPPGLCGGGGKGGSVASGPPRQPTARAASAAVRPASDSVRTTESGGKPPRTRSMSSSATQPAAHAAPLARTQRRISRARPASSVAGVPPWSATVVATHAGKPLLRSAAFTVASDVGADCHEDDRMSEAPLSLTMVRSAVMHGA